MSQEETNILVWGFFLFFWVYLFIHLGLKQGYKIPKISKGLRIQRLLHCGPGNASD